MEGVYKKYTPSKQGVYFIYTLHFSLYFLVHSQTVLGVLYVLYMLSVFFDLRCESVIYIYMTLKFVLSQQVNYTVIESYKKQQHRAGKPGMYVL